MPRSSGTGETSSSGHTTPAPGQKRSGFHSPAPPAKVPTRRGWQRHHFRPPAQPAAQQQPAARPAQCDSTPLAAGGAEASLRVPDGDSYPVATQKSARRSHAKIMSSTVSRFSQAPQAYVLTPVPEGAVPRHACATPPAMHTVQSHPHIFFENMRGQPQISSPSLGGVGVDLGVDSLTMSGLVPDKFNSEHNQIGRAH